MAAQDVLCRFASLCALVTVMTATPTAASSPGKKVFCYYSSFAQNRQGAGKFLPEDVDAFLCTHIIFAFVDIDPSGTDLMAFNRNDVGSSGLYERTIALKERNPALKVLLAVGGWQIGSKPFIPMISDESNMRQWIKNVVRYLRKYDFDGFDMDWEFPATRGSPPEDKYRYTKLMKGLYEAFAEEARQSGREKLLLTMATASGTYFINTSYEPHKIVKYMDFMLLMTYNYHGQWEKRTGHHSPMWKHRNDLPGEQSELYQNWSIDYWLEMGVPKEKLVVGLATYGMSFTLVSPDQHDVHAPANGGGRMGPYTKETGILSYYEICDNIQNHGWQTGWVEDQDVPYAYGGDQWVGYDNVASIKIKADNIVKRDLAGAFVWSVEMDDFSNVCGGGKYPLLSTVTRVLKPYQGVAQVAPAQTEPKGRPAVPAVVSRQASRTTPTPAQPQAAEDGDEAEEQQAVTKSPALSKGQRVTWWGKPTWRPLRRHSEQAETHSEQAETTKAPWWRRSTPSAHRPSNQHHHRTPHWNVRPRGQSVTSSLTTPERTTTAGTQKMLATQEATMSKVPQTTQHKEGENSVHNKGDYHSGKRRQESSAGAKIGAAIDCRKLGSGLFPHPDDCEKFVMCLPGAWMDYPPHIMNCPAGTRFDDYLKVCNHATSVECWS